MDILSTLPNTSNMYLGSQNVEPKISGLCLSATVLHANQSIQPKKCLRIHSDMFIKKKTYRKNLNS